MTSDPLRQSRGPFYARQIRDGDPYELENGHPIECLPSGEPVGRESDSASRRCRESP